MKPHVIIKILNFLLNKNLINIVYIFFFLSLFLVFLAIYFQPLVGDDYYFKEDALSKKNLIIYFSDMYLNWTGRVSMIILTYWIFSDDVNLIFYKLSVIPLLLFVFYFFLKNIIRFEIKFFSIDYVILFICFWYIYPAINETIFWTTGSIVYLIPLFFSIFYLGLFTGIEETNIKNIFKYIFFLVSSFLAGSSHLQAFVGCFVVSTYFMFLYYRQNRNRFKKLILFYFLFCVGGALLILAPGNISRLSYDGFETSGLISIIYKSILFIVSSVFYLGDLKSSLVYFLLIMLFFFLFIKRSSVTLLYEKSYYIWLVTFLFSLICVIPAINSVTTRVIFFPIFFLTIFFLKIIFSNYNYNYNLKIKKFVFLFLVIVFFLESFLGSLTNFVYNKESNIRMSLIKDSKKKLNDQVIISHYSIIPSRYTYIHTPEQDRQFLNNISKIYKIKINYDDSLPRSKKIRKDIKFYLDKF
jgi:hypothetical protein